VSFRLDAQLWLGLKTGFTAALHVYIHTLQSSSCLILAWPPLQRRPGVRQTRQLNTFQLPSCLSGSPSVLEMDKIVATCAASHPRIISSRTRQWHFGLIIRDMSAAGFSDDKIQLVEWSTSAVFSFPKPFLFRCDDRSLRTYCVDMILKDGNDNWRGWMGVNKKILAEKELGICPNYNPMCLSSNRKGYTP
jgi:hypothetical protein